MFQIFRYQWTQPSVTSAPKSCDSPREEPRRDTSVSSDEPHTAHPVAREEDFSTVEPEAREQDRTEGAEHTPQGALGAATDAPFPAGDEPQHATQDDAGADADEDLDGPLPNDVQATPPPRLSRRRGRQRTAYPRFAASTVTGFSVVPFVRQAASASSPRRGRRW